MTEERACSAVNPVESNSARIRQSRPDSGHDIQGQILVLACAIFSANVFKTI